MHQGGVVGCPAEAVWGLSCDPLEETAVARLLALKQRPVSKGLILVAASMAQIDGLLEGLSKPQYNKLALSWPGPTTWLIPHHGRVPSWIHGGHQSVAVRVTAHPVLSALCAIWGGALVSTSANPAGAQPAVEAFQVRRYFADSLDALVPGVIGARGRPSVIRDLISDEILRT